VAGPEVEAASWELDLYLRGEQLDPTALTALLGVTPSDTRTRGHTRVLSSGKSVVTTVGVWKLKVRAGSPTECVNALAARFGGRVPDLSHLPGVEAGFLDMFVSFEPGRGPGSEVLVKWEPIALRQLAESGLPLQITFAVVGL
jgi:hypothetical protein